MCQELQFVLKLQHTKFGQVIDVASKCLNPLKIIKMTFLGSNPSSPTTLYSEKCRFPKTFPVCFQELFE